ncbi:MAG: DUF456 domain-containing protein [Planctomycetota bacterium]
MLDVTLLILAIAALLLINAAGVVLVAIQLPGTWLMIAATAVFAWWRWGQEHWSYGWWTLAALLVLAALGELVEFAASAMGSRQVGGSKRGAALSIATALIGAILGSFLIPIPIVGTLLGAALGAGAGASLGDKWAGRSWAETAQGFKGAAIGKLSGAAVKLVISVMMWLTAVLALLV